MRPVLVFTLIVSLVQVPLALAEFHLFRRQKFTNASPGDTGCQYTSTLQIGAVPSVNNGCSDFMQDSYFQQAATISTHWGTIRNYPGICGSNPVDMYVEEDGMLGIYEHGSKENLLASCQGQGDELSICPEEVNECADYARLYDAWRCDETDLCP